MSTIIKLFIILATFQLTFGLDPVPKANQSDAQNALDQFQSYYQYILAQDITKVYQSSKLFIHNQITFGIIPEITGWIETKINQVNISTQNQADFINNIGILTGNCMDQVDINLDNLRLRAFDTLQLCTNQSESIALEKLSIVFGHAHTHLALVNNCLFNAYNKCLTIEESLAGLCFDEIITDAAKAENKLDDLVKVYDASLNAIYYGFIDECSNVVGETLYPSLKLIVDKVTSCLTEAVSFGVDKTC